MRLIADDLDIPVRYTTPSAVARKMGVQVSTVRWWSAKLGLIRGKAHKTDLLPLDADKKIAEAREGSQRRVQTQATKCTQVLK